MNRTLGTVAVMAALAATACAGRQNVDPESVAGGADSVHVETVNDNFYDARIHAVYGSGTRRTLGTIPGNGGRSEVAIPWEPRELVFEISFVISGAAYVTYPIDVGRGESFELRLPPNIDASGFFRRVAARD